MRLRRRRRVCGRRIFCFAYAPGSCRSGSVPGEGAGGSNPDIPGIRVCFINAGLIIKINWDKGRCARWWVYIRLIKAAGPGTDFVQ